MFTTTYSIERQKLMVMEVERWGEPCIETSEDELATASTLGARLWKLFDRLVLALGATAITQHPCDDETLVFYHGWMIGY
jgi:hypothetical protein